MTKQQKNRLYWVYAMRAQQAAFEIAAPNAHGIYSRKGYAAACDRYDRNSRLAEMYER